MIIHFQFWDTRQSQPIMSIQLPERAYCADVVSILFFITHDIACLKCAINITDNFIIDYCNIMLETKSSS